MKNPNTTITKFLFGILFLSMFTLFGFNESTLLSESNPVEVNVTMGDRYPGGRELCVINSPNENVRSTYDAKGEIYLNAQGKLILEINKVTISVAKSQEQFFDGKFVLEDDFKLSNELMAALNIQERNSTLRKGNYPLTETNDKYVITF